LTGLTPAMVHRLAAGRSSRRGRICRKRGNPGNQTNVERSGEFFCPGNPRGKRVPLSPFLRKTQRKQIVDGRYERRAIRRGLAMSECRFPKTAILNAVNFRRELN
jgi:hypothetical protein